MSGPRGFTALCHGLQRSGLSRVELYRKEGRSRRFESGLEEPRLAIQSREMGWAVRAGGQGGSLFAAGTGEQPEPDGPWPELQTVELRLPAPQHVAPWTRPAELDVPLLSENEANGLMARIGRRLTDELKGARLVRAQLSEGVSTARLQSTEGIDATVQHRSATLFLEAIWERGSSGSDGQAARVSWYVAARSARAFSPSALGRRVADLLLVRGRGGTVERDRGDVLLAAPAASVLLEHLTPVLVGPDADRTGRPFRDRRTGRMGGAALTVIDDGRLPGGLFDAPIDGEGVETRRQPLVEEGIFRQPLLSWRQVSAGRRSSGCVARSSWRDRPRPQVTHLFLQPDSSVSAGGLLRGVARGFYVLDVTGPGSFDFEQDRFELPVCGFVLRRGSAAGSFAQATLRGAVGALLRGVQAAARDLTFHAAGGRIGSPSLLVNGVELAGASG